MQKIYALFGGAALIALLVGSGAAVYLQRQGDPLAECRGTAVAGGQIGGPFTLVNGDGQTVTDTDVLAKPSLVYFGYSFCPDVCPMDNARNAEAADKLQALGRDVTPVFISVDHKRDTPAIMKDYAANISPKMVALTGSEDQIKAAAKAYKVYYNIPNPNDEYYSVDHTTFTYLMLPGKGFMDVFDRDTTADDMVKRVSCYLDKTES